MIDIEKVVSAINYNGNPMELAGGGGITPTTITFATECNDFGAVGAIVKSFLPSTFERVVLLADWVASQTYDFTAAVIYGQTETLPIGAWVRGTAGNNCGGNWTATYSARVPAGATYSMYVLR